MVVRPRLQRGRRPSVRHVVVVVPSLFTLANLFFGIWSIVLSSTGDFYRASWYIVIAGILDMLDGRVARMSNAGSRFGAELDSLVDIVSFGVAPAVLLYHLVFAPLGGFSWMFSFGFVAGVALRLARYNVADEDHDPVGGFQGIPSPAAGMTLATYYPFTQTDFYQTQLLTLPWAQIIIYLTIAMSLAMVSTIRYARVPRIGVRSIKGLAGLAVNGTIVAFAVWSRDIFFFPLGLAYLSYGMARAAVIGFLERGELGEDVEDAGEEMGEDHTVGPMSRGA